MAKLYRPYIPYAVRETVLRRQLTEAGRALPRLYTGMSEWLITGLVAKLSSARARVKLLIWQLFGDARVELHHRPALCNRDRVTNSLTGQFIRYDPDANDPDFLVYLRAGAGEDHDVETRVRGLYGQHSDLALRRIAKRKARKETARLLRSGPWGKLSGGHRKWPKRKLRSRNDLRRRKGDGKARRTRR